MNFLSSTLPDTADHVVISRNPFSGRKSSETRGLRLQKRLEELKIRAEVTTDLDEAEQKARALHADGRLRALVGIGGDGTAAELLNRTEPGTPITLLPAGNANLLAKLYRIGRSPEKLAEIIAAGCVRTLDVGRANGRLFLVTLSAGLDAEIVARVHAKRHARLQGGAKKGGHVTNFSYVRPACAAMLGYRFPKIRVEAFDASPRDAEPDAVFENPRWAFIFNMNRYAWGLPLVPGAKPDDGKLDHCLFTVGSSLAGAVYIAFAQVFGLHRFLPTVRLGQAQCYRLRPVEDGVEIPYQIDGDPGGTFSTDSPLDIETVPGRLSFVVPG